MRLTVHAAGSGPAVVLLHGLFGSARNLGALQRDLAGRFRVLALDLRNHGDSPHGAMMDYATLADDVRETLAAEGVTTAAVVGHSMGGKVAMTLALQSPALVQRLLVADIAPVSYPSHFAGYVAAMLQIPVAYTRQQADTALREAVPDPAVRGFLLHNFRSGTGWRVGLAEIAAQLPAIEGWTGTWSQPYAGPVLFVTGARSDYVQDADRPVIRALFPAARFVAIPNAGHWLHAEQPAAFNATVDTFLRSLA